MIILVKMKYSVQLFGLICFFAISSCSYGQKRVKSVPVIDIAGNFANMEEIYLSRFSDNIRYVPLQSNMDHPLRWNTNLYADFSENYIVDSDGRTCLLYNNDGHFIKQIGSQGRGPGEYTGIRYVKLMNNKILIYEYSTDDLIEYKIDGSFVKRYNSGLTGNKKYRMLEATFLNDSLIFGNIENFTGKDEFKALIIDYQGNIIKYYKNYIFFKLDPGLSHAQSPGDAIYYSFGNKTFFKEFLNDTLFQLDDKFKLTPSYVFNFGKYKESLSDRGKRWTDIDLDSYFCLYQINQTENFLILDCGLNKYFPAKRLTPEIIRLPGMKDYTQWYNTRSVTGIYDEKTGKLVFAQPSTTDNHLSASGIYNDIDAGPRFVSNGMVNDSTMVMKIRFDYLIEHIKSADFKKNMPKYPDRKKKLEMFVDSLKKAEFDNPVYMFVTFNK
jgi:hypothetical protein